MPTKKTDLTFSIHEGMTTFPVSWHPMVEISQLGRHHVENRETRKLVLGTHTGTHCDAPLHFVPGGETIDMVALDTLIGPAIVLDLSASRPFQKIEIQDLASRLGERKPERVILRYDWSDHWDRPDYYSDHPYLSEEAAGWLVDRGVRLLAMDTPMPDNPKHGRGSPVDSPIHRILLGNGVILTEYLCNLRALTQENVDLIVLPLKIAGGDGAPARCVAIETW